MAAGVVALVLGAWVFAALYIGAGDRVDVVALAKPVGRNDTIERSDLKVVRVGIAGEGVRTVPAGQLDQLVGHTAVSDLPAGALLAPGQIRTTVERQVGDGEAIVGVLIPAGKFPGGLTRGDDVYVVVRAADEDGEPTIEHFNGWIYRADSDPLDNGDQPMEVVVTENEASVVSAAAAEDSVTVVALDE